jgi:hypothetical protein
MLNSLIWPLPVNPKHCVDENREKAATKVGIYCTTNVNYLQSPPGQMTLTLIHKMAWRSDSIVLLVYQIHQK